MAITGEYIPHDKQVAIYTLHSLGYPLRKIAKSVDVSLPVVWMLSKQIPSDLTEVERYKKGLIGWNYSVSQRAMNRITDDKLDKMNALQLMTIGAIGVDKARDLEGANRPVFNIVTVVNECKQTRDKLEAQIARVRSARQAITSTALEHGAIS